VLRRIGRKVAGASESPSKSRELLAQWSTDEFKKTVFPTVWLLRCVSYWKLRRKWHILF